GGGGAGLPTDSYTPDNQRRRARGVGQRSHLRTQRETRRSDLDTIYVIRGLLTVSASGALGGRRWSPPDRAVRPCRPGPAADEHGADVPGRRAGGRRIRGRRG